MSEDCDWQTLAVYYAQVIMQGAAWGISASRRQTVNLRFVCLTRANLQPPMSQQQIGRASCRERV